MYEKLLPLGSVVMLEGDEKKVMITGRVQIHPDGETVYEYSGCYYPEGIVSDKLKYFNTRDIKTAFFIGFQDVEEFAFKSEVLSKLSELKIVNGRIVEVEEGKDSSVLH